MDPEIQNNINKKSMYSVKISTPPTTEPNAIKISEPAKNLDHNTNSAKAKRISRDKPWDKNN